MKNLSTMAAALAVAGTVLLTTPTFAATMSSMSSASPDATFSKKFAMAGAAEMALAREALKTSKNPQVLQFARKMISDHTRAGSTLASIAGPKGYATPMKPDPASAAMAQSLMSMKGAGFDATYKKDNVMGHEQALALLKTEIADGKDTSLVAYAKATLPTVQQHLTLAEALPST